MAVLFLLFEEGGGERWWLGWFVFLAVTRLSFILEYWKSHVNFFSPGLEKSLEFCVKDCENFTIRL